MPSIIEGYNYDIFISYRQKDNKGDRWVSEFVEALKTELESTFKEEISVYFDINPHDGLLETHDVDESLKDKLKCLVFIPIISRTYCDPKSFAWEHEFKAFVELVSEDQYGLKVKVPGGNVASRVLPVQIHDLDSEDKKLVENELGGFLRGVEFIYREPGVNRPLKPDDDEKINLNKTKYRNQINKVANAIKEVITAIKQHGARQEEELQEEVKPILSPPKNHKTTIIAGLAIALVLIVLGILFIPKLIKPKEHLEKSIAVLPFINDSPDQENTYFINGIMVEVLNNLQKIKEFRVLSRTSTEQYMGTARLPIPKIGKELNVNYIVEGSGQKYGNKFILRVQLIAANNERHLWAKSYNREIQQTSDIINIQSEIAQLIAKELEATITPQEKELIEKTPTTSLTAYDFYQRGEEELGKYDENNPSTWQTLKRAEEMYKYALMHDSTFAEAYKGLALVYYQKSYYKSYLSKYFLDSVMIFANRALSFNDKLADAYLIRANYYSEYGKTEQAIRENEKALKYNPNYWEAYWNIGNLFSSYDLIDWVKSIENYQKALSLNHGKNTPEIYRSLGGLLANYAGFQETANYYFQEAFKLDGDSLAYISSLAMEEKWLGNYKKAIELYGKCYAIDSNSTWILSLLASCYEDSGQYKESLEYFKKYTARLETLGQTTERFNQRIGYAYWMNGFKEEANYWFNEQKKYCEETIKLGRAYSTNLSAYYDLAGVYAFLGEKSKAYENLRLFNKIQVCALFWVTLIKDDPLFNSIKNEPEFQQIQKDIEAKYLTEHERVRKWLEEHGEV